MKAARAGGGQAIKHSAAGDDWCMETVLTGQADVRWMFTFRIEDEWPNEQPNEKPTRLTKSNAWMPNAVTRPSANVQRPSHSTTTAGNAAASPQPEPSKT